MTIDLRNPVRGSRLTKTLKGTVLVAAVVAAGGALVSTADAAKARSQPCRQPGSTLVRSTKLVRLYDRPSEDAIVHYACSRTSNRRSEFGQTTISGTDPDHVYSATPVRFAGHYGANSSTDCISPKFFSDRRPSCETFVYSIDLRTGKTKYSARGSAVATSQEFQTFVNRVVLQTSGSVAWSADTATTHGSEVVQRNTEISRITATGLRLLASGDGLDSGSLALVGRALSWSRAGVRETTTLR